MEKKSIHSWKLLGSKTVFDRRWYRVRRDRVKIAPGKIINDYFLGVFPDIVLVVALTKDGKIPLVRQYKHGAGKILLEVPAGYIDKYETPLHAAKRELTEETGYGAGTWKQLGFFYSNPTKEKGNGLYIFFAKGVTQVAKAKMDETEAIDVFLVRRDTVIKKMLKNEIKVAGSMLALLLALVGKK
ncbi:MAG: NUDIX hydrolase [Candidatus Liptonbacteria bacterium]|nr:NUDIX hydrolase [Candidatus Liptonbacteria bacterium]